MTDNNSLTLAVAGSGKTRSVVSDCARSDHTGRVLVITYTSENQREITQRLATNAGDRHNIEVNGWFTFLIRNFVRPYLPFAYPGQRVKGFDFMSQPQQYLANDMWARYFNKHDEVRKVHLSQLAHRINEASQGAAIRRLERVYSQIFIDEVQDLCGWDLEVLRLLMASKIRLNMVGDVRQAILVTNNRESKNRQYMFLKIWNWFRKEERSHRVSIRHKNITYRCRQEIATFADSLFHIDYGFQQTISKNGLVTNHDGIFLVKESDVEAYIQTHDPLFLRWSSSSGKKFSHLSPMNIGVSKGLGRKNVLIHPTANMASLLRYGKDLDEKAAAYLYVAVTRAEQSVAFILDSPGSCKYEYWSPESE